LNENTSALRDFLLAEMKRRNMSARQYAQFLGVSNTTINRLVDARDPDEPSLSFMVKLARATKVSLVSLLDLSYPDLADLLLEDPEARVLLEELVQLPSEDRVAITHALRMMIRGSKAQEP
jgi:transcriptional regulator with XRE-family HTH domain